MAAELDARSEIDRPFLFELSDAPLNTADLAASFDDEGAGACIVFEGRVRNHNEGRQVAALEYEAYPAMAVKEGTAVMTEVARRFEVIGARCIHRIGRLEIGDVAVWVAVLAAHREEGFAACRYVIDEVKSRVPIWKKEHYAEGDTAWVAPHSGPREAD